MAKEKQSSTELAVKANAPGGALALNEIMGDIETYAGSGREDVKASDLSLPFWRLAQSMTPECKRSDPAYIDGLKEGMWFDTITREFFDEIVFVPTRFRTEYIEWQPISKGGGFVANHGLDEKIMDSTFRDQTTGRDVTKDGTEIVPTMVWYGIVIGGTRDGEEITGMCRQAVISLSRTAFKIGRRWGSELMAIRIKNSAGKVIAPPFWLNTYRLNAKTESSAQFAWMSPVVNRNGFLTDVLPAEDVVTVKDAAISFADLTKATFAAPAKVDDSVAMAA